MKIGTMLVAGAVMVLGLLAVSACGDATQHEPSGPSSAAKDEPKEAAPVLATPPTEPPKPAEAKPEAAAESGDVPTIGPTIGVAECDDYVAKMHACFATDVIPAETRDEQKLGFDASVRGWADAVAANPGSRDVLVEGCKAALDMARMAYPGCFADGP